MLARYTMHRDRRPDVEGVRMDTRKHTRHCLRPGEEIVIRYLAGNADYPWALFSRDYRALIEERFAADRTPFDALAERARHEDIYLGCSCPTKKNPDVMHCHTVLALEFMRARYPDLQVVLPKPTV